MNEVIEMDEPELRIAMPQTTSMAVTTPASLLQIAVQRGASLDELTALMNLQERFEKGEAEKAFNKAKAAFGAESIVILKDKVNTQFKSKYSSVGSLVNTARPYLGKHGFSTSWTQKQEGNKITVTCRMTHSQGHFVEDSFEVPPDKSGAKNALQEIKSAITYARITTFENVTGLVSSDESGDDDGNGSNPPKEKPIHKTALSGESWKRALSAVKSKQYTIKEIEVSHTLTEDQRTAMMDAEKEVA